MSEDLFKNAEPSAAPEGGTTPEASHLDTLVGDGKKFADHEALAKGKVESDMHITNLEKELSGMREDLNSRLNMQTFLDRLEKSGVTSTDATPASENAGNAGSEVGTANVTMQDIEAMVAQKLNETTAASQRDTNTRAAISTLQQNLGSSYGDKVLAATQELGVSKEFMTDLAATNPTAFLKLVGADKTPAAQANPSTYTAPRTSVNTGATITSNTGIKRDSYYSDMRKSDSKRFWSKEVQVEMHREAQKQGESFFDKP